MKTYADLHCHPGAPAYDENRLARKNPRGDRQPFHPWHIPASNVRRQKKSKRAFGYSQSDLAKSSVSQTTLLFAALYPTEKGFFFGIKEGRTRHDILRLFQLAQEAKKKGDEDSAAEEFFLQLTPTEQKEFSKRTAVDELQSNKMNYSLERIQYVQSGDYDYYKELNHEYEFWLTLDSKSGSTPAPIQLMEGGPAQVWNGSYQLATPSTLSQQLSAASSPITVVITIEGIHALGTGNYGWENVSDASPVELLHRVNELKNPAKWPHRPFFITFSHHFSNRLCGHAHSLPGFSRKVLFDQDEMLDEGFTETGLQVARSLLGLDSNLMADGSPRILIDVKHMSAKGRKELFDQIIKPFNSRQENANCKIPVVASHIGYSGVSHLQALIDKAMAGNEDDNDKVNGFYAWNINLSNEDVIEIHNSGGLMGISFDQRILGLDKVLVAFNVQEFLKSKRRKSREAKEAVSRTIEAIIAIPFENKLANPHLIWNELAIGTDFDGFIDPLFGYSTVMDFPDFENDLVHSLEEIQNRHSEWFATLTPALAARKICFDNARDFVLQHYK
jgi:hypothetical protein